MVIQFKNKGLERRLAEYPDGINLASQRAVDRYLFMMAAKPLELSNSEIELIADACAVWPFAREEVQLAVKQLYAQVGVYLSTPASLKHKAVNRNRLLQFLKDADEYTTLQILDSVEKHWRKVELKSAEDDQEVHQNYHVIDGTTGVTKLDFLFYYTIIQKAAILCEDVGGNEVYKLSGFEQLMKAVELLRGKGPFEIFPHTETGGKNFIDRAPSHLKEEAYQRVGG